MKAKSNSIFFLYRVLICSWSGRRLSNLTLPTGVYDQPSNTYPNTGSLPVSGDYATGQRTNSPVGYEAIYPKNSESILPHSNKQTKDQSAQQTAVIATSSQASYASIDPSKKCESKTSSHGQYSQVDVERKKHLREVHSHTTPFSTDYSCWLICDWCSR
jgi:hypothetical protein